MHTINIDMEKCIGCKQCYKACFVDVICWDAEAKKQSLRSLAWKL